MLTRDTYSWWVPAGAVGASKLYADIFNASGSGKILEVLALYLIPKTDAAVAGVLAVEIGLYRTSAVGTGGTAHTYNGGTTSAAHVITPYDTNNAALPAQVTARTVPTGGATIAALYQAPYAFTEETGPGAHQQQNFNILEVPPGVVQGSHLRLREGQGLLIKQGTVASVGSMAFRAVLALT